MNQLSSDDNLPPSYIGEDETFHYFYKVAISGLLDVYLEANPESNQEAFIANVVIPAFKLEAKTPGIHTTALVKSGQRTTDQELQVLKINVVLGHIANALTAKKYGQDAHAWASLIDAHYFGGAVAATQRNSFTKNAVIRQIRQKNSQDSNDERHAYNRSVKEELFRLIQLLKSKGKWRSTSSLVQECIADVRIFEVQWQEQTQEKRPNHKKHAAISVETLKKWGREMLGKGQFDADSK